MRRETRVEVAENVMYGGRVVGGDLQTAVQEYRHVDGRSILLIGCVHMAEPDYFAQVRKIVDQAETSGATVYMERVSFAEEDRSDASDGELAAIRASRTALTTQYSDLPRLLDLPWV